MHLGSCTCYSVYKLYQTLPNATNTIPNPPPPSPSQHVTRFVQLFSRLLTLTRYTGVISARRIGYLN